MAKVTNLRVHPLPYLLRIIAHLLTEKSQLSVTERRTQVLQFHLCPDSSFSEFSAPTVEDVTACVRSSPNKQCTSDPLLTWFLKVAIDTPAPFLTTLPSAFLAGRGGGELPPSWKCAIILPHPMRSELDQTEVVRNFRPVANLPFLSKLLENMMNRQLIAYLTWNELTTPLGLSGGPFY